MLFTHACIVHVIVLQFLLSHLWELTWLKLSNTIYLFEQAHALWNILKDALSKQMSERVMWRGGELWTRVWYKADGWIQDWPGLSCAGRISEAQTWRRARESHKLGKSRLCEVRLLMVVERCRPGEIGQWDYLPIYKERSNRTKVLF